MKQLPAYPTENVLPDSRFIRLKMLFPNSRQESGLLICLKDYFPVFLPDILRFVRMNIFLTSLYDQLPVLSAYN